MMQLWGLCPECDTWFYLTLKQEDWHCPSCQREPIRLENRATMPYAPDRAAAVPAAVPRRQPRAAGRFMTAVKR